jgi:H+/Cl- antiporter ClcA
MRRSFTVAWPFLMALSFVFCITISIFPYVTTDTNLEFLNFIDNNDLRYAWTLQILVTVFNVGDTVSRVVRNQKWGNVNDKAALVISYSGLIFLAASFVIAFNTGPEWLTGKDGDWFKILNMFLFSFWNGYCGA